MATPRFAVFDIDGTLIRWQLYHAVVDALADAGKLSPEAQKTIQIARMEWKKRTHSQSFHEYEQKLLKVYLPALHNIRTNDYQAAVNAAFEEYKDQTYTYTRDLIRSLKSQDYMLLAVSGSHTEIIAKMAEYYGFDDFNAAEFEQRGGYLTGKVKTPFGQKAGPLKALVKKHGLSFAGSIGVGDSASDISMLELVDNPVAFNPAAELFAHATNAGWRVVVERKNMVYELEQKNGTYILAEANSR